MMKLEVGKKYWIKAEYKKLNEFNDFQHWFEVVDALDGMVMLDDVSEVKEVIPETEKVKIPLYWVRDKEGRSLLYNSDNGVEASHGYSVVVQKDNIERFTFTEKEIKDYDERYWAFAVSVEEEDDE